VVKGALGTKGALLRDLTGVCSGEVSMVLWALTSLPWSLHLVARCLLWRR
jgi:hypothetical protein